MTDGRRCVEPAPRKKLSAHCLDYLIVAGLLVLSVLGALAWWRGVVPFAFIGGDSGVIASIAAAWSYPERFAGDLVLSDPDNFKFYFTVQILMLRVLAPIIGDFGTAYISLLGPTIFVQAVGWYILGKRLFRDRSGALVLALSSFGTVGFTVDYYGLYTSVEPRFMFQAILPYLLWLMLRYAPNPANWPWLMALHGLAIYVHPVSAPTVALASLFGFLVFRPDHEKFGVTLSRLFVAGICFLIITVPFLYFYLSSHEHGGTADYAQMASTFSQLFGDYYVDAFRYVAVASSRWQVRFFLTIWGTAGLALLLWSKRADRAQVSFFLVWLVGIIGGSVGITLAEQAVYRRLELVPVEIDLIRNIRYVVPILMLFGIWGLTMTKDRLGSRRWAVVALIAVIAWLGVNRPGSVPFRSTLACLSRGSLLCPPAYWRQHFQILSTLKELPPRTTVLPLVRRGVGEALALAVRYFALQPTLFVFKDGGSVLGYGNHKALGQWLDTNRAVESIVQMDDGPEKTARSLDLAARLTADILITDFPLDPMIRATRSLPVVATADYEVVRLKRRPPSLR